MIIFDPTIFEGFDACITILGYGIQTSMISKYNIPRGYKVWNDLECILLFCELASINNAIFKQWYNSINIDFKILKNDFYKT